MEIGSYSQLNIIKCVLFYILLPFFLDIRTVHGDVGQIYPENELTQGTEFVYYTETMTWNEAYDVCKTGNGTLAKVDSMYMRELIYSMAESAEETFDQDYWIGLIQPEDGQFIWVSDCSSLREEQKVNFKIDGFKNTEMCIKMKRADHTGDEKTCTETRAFICQYQTSVSCDYNTRFEGKLVSSSSSSTLSESECSVGCNNEPSSCWGYMYTAAKGTCLLLGDSSASGNGTIIKSKFCYSFRKDTSRQQKSGNTGQYPIHNCNGNSDSPIIPSASVSVSASFASVSVCPTVTQFVTQSVYHTVTSSVQEFFPVSVFVTEIATQQVSVHITATETLYLTQSVSVSISVTKTVTETVVQTHINNITVVQAEEVAKEIVKNLTVDAKTTSSFVRSKTSASDPRASARYMGLLGILFVGIPMGLIILFDCRRVYMDLRNYRNIFKKD